MDCPYCKNHKLTHAGNTEYECLRCNRLFNALIKHDEAENTYRVVLQEINPVFLSSRSHSATKYLAQHKLPKMTPEEFNLWNSRERIHAESTSLT